jgi:lysophospholipase L1-like esterase
LTTGAADDESRPVVAPRDCAQHRNQRRVVALIGAALLGGCAGSSPGPFADAAAGIAPPGSPDASRAGAPDLAPPPPPVDAAPEPSPPDAAPADVGSRDGPAGVVKIMVLGSSNEVITCWRAFLWQKLRAAGVTAFDYVGSQTGGPDCGVPGYDKDSESRSGTVVTSISAATWTERFKAHPPDIVLMHIGGADLLQNIAPARVLEAYSLAVTQARAVNPQVRFLVAQHTPEESSGCKNCRQTVMELNASIVTWAMQIGTAASAVSPVDLYTGIDLATDTSDRVHLNDAGSQKVSDRWLAALLPLLKP